MTNLIMTLNSIKNLKDYENIKYIQRYIVGHNDYALRIYKNFELDDIQKLCKETQREVYVNMNRIFHQKELKNLENYLKKLKELPISGIIFSDFAVFQIVKSMNWNIKLTYSTDTTITSSSFTMLAKENNINDIELAKEITLKEIIQINSKKQTPIIMFGHGHIYMYNSFRKLVSNYKNEVSITENLEDKDLQLYDDERDVYYPIIENEKGTNILSASDQSSLTVMYEILSNDIDYLKLDSFGYEEEDFKNIVKSYEELMLKYEQLKEQNLEEFEKDIKKLSKKLNKQLKENIPYKVLDNGFLKKKSIY